MTAAIATAPATANPVATLDSLFDAAISRLDNRVVWKTGFDFDDAWTVYATRQQLAGLSLQVLSYLLRAMERRHDKTIGYPALDLLSWHCGRLMRSSYHSERVCSCCGFVQTSSID